MTKTLGQDYDQDNDQVNGQVNMTKTMGTTMTKTPYRLSDSSQVVIRSELVCNWVREPAQVF